MSDIKRQHRNANLLILFTKCNQGSYFATHKRSEAFLILQVNPVIWGIWGEKREVVNTLC